MGHLLDPIATSVQTYRNNIVFSLNKDDLSVSAGLIPSFHAQLPTGQRDVCKLSPMPAKPIFETVTLNNPKAEYKFTSTYQKELRTWLLESLKIIEQGWSKFLYSRRQMLNVLQIAVQSYRHSLLFNLQNDREPEISIGLLQIMNALLPEKFRGVFEERPPAKGKLSWMYRSELQDWVIRNMQTFELAEGKYVYSVMAASNA